MPTIRDVANLAGVSTATVSRVLNNHPQISQDARSRVTAAIEQLDYQLNRVARRLRTDGTQILGLIISDIANPFFTSVVRGIEDVAYENQYSLLLCNSDEDPTKEELYIRVLLGEKVAGVIMSPTDEYSTNSKVLIESRIPVVAMDRRLCSLDVDTVIVDNVQGAYDAVDHLIQLGHCRIAFVGGPVQITTARERKEGYKKALQDHALPVDETLIKVGDFKQDSGYYNTGELLAMDDPPAAIFVANNLMTLGALNAIHEKGLNIPRDVAIVGFDDMPWAPSLDPPLTTISQPTYDMGRTTADLLLKRIADNNREKVEIKLRPTLIVRKSSGFPVGKEVETVATQR
jgi:DNA-binding LacI/PurR family transcriptional regulator